MLIYTLPLIGGVFQLSVIAIFAYTLPLIGGVFQLNIISVIAIFIPRGVATRGIRVGLDKLCFCLLPIIFFLTILKKSAYYSSLVYPLFQFKDVTFILKRQFCGCIV